MGAEITASISTTEISLVPAPLTIGIVTNGLGNGSGFPNNPLNIVACSPNVLTPPGQPDSVSGNQDPSAFASNSLKISIIDGFLGAFLNAANEDGGLGGRQGTRFRIRLADIPNGIIPYAPLAVRTTSDSTTGEISPSSSSMVVRRVDGAEDDGSGGLVLPEVADQFDKIEVREATATIVYEVTADSQSSVDAITLFIVPTSSGPLAQGNAVASLSLAAVGPPTIAPARPQFASSTAISLNSDQLTFYGFEGTNPDPLNLTISNSGVGVLNWNAAITSSSGGDWLTLSSTSGVNDANLTLTVDSNLLPIGTYRATITFTSLNSLNSPQIIPVKLFVSTPLALGVTPSSLDFVVSFTGEPASQSLLINSNCCATEWAASIETSSGGNWLSISPPTGLTATQASVSINTEGLSSGAYEGSIEISGPEATNGPQTIRVSLIVGAPSIRLTPSSLTFITSEGADPIHQTVNIQNAGAGILGWDAGWATQSGGNWLQVNPTTAVAPSSMEVVVNPEGLLRGAYTGTVTISALPGTNAINSPQVLSIGLAVDAPVIHQNGIVNAASLTGESIVSPGLIATMFGTNLAPFPAAAENGTVLPIVLAGTQVLVNGGSVPLFFASPDQINFQVPENISGASAEVVVVSNGVFGLPATVSLEEETPGIFSITGSGSGQGAVLNENSTLNSANNPAPNGSIIMIYAAGLGTVEPAVPAGHAAGTEPLSRTQKTPLVLIGGVPAEISYSGLAPGLVGVYQVNARIPMEVSGGNSVPLQLQIGTAESNVVTIAVE